MSNKNKIILVAIIFSLVVLFSGLTFAYFTSQTNNESGSTIVVKGGTMTVVYAGGTGDIIVDNIYPRDEEWATKTFTVTGNNSTELDMDYRLYLVTTSNAFNFGDLTYTISGTSTNASDTLIQKNDQKIPKNGEILMGRGIFKSNNATHSYSLKIYYKENNTDQNNGQEKNYTGYVRLNNGSTLAYDAVINSNSSTPMADTAAFNGPVSVGEIEKITFNNTNALPSNAIESWDAGESQTGSIVAYTLDEDNNNLYELYIGQEGKVKLGPNANDIFANYSKTTVLDVSNLDTSAVTSMQRMFLGCKAKSIVGLENFDTSNVTDMLGMFVMSSFTSLDLSSFDTSKVTDMRSMFGLAAVEKVDVSNFDTLNVTTMGGMFGSSFIQEIIFGDKFNTSKVTNMNTMFRAVKAETLDVSSFDTSNVTNMADMFEDCSAKSIIGLDKFNTSKVTDMSGMFYNTAAPSLDLSSFDTSNVTKTTMMFKYSKATVGYARTQADADKFNASSGKPSGLTFTVKS